MTEQDQKELGKTLWAIANDLRGAMNADDFRDYMLSFLFLRYLSDNFEEAAKKELGRDYPAPNEDDRRAPLASGMKITVRILPTLKTKCASRCIMSSSRNSCGAVLPKWRARSTMIC